MKQEEFIGRAIDLAMKSVESGGGPFGAVVVKDGKIIAEGMNRVTSDHDPTAHAEVVAIREAAAALKDFNLEGCEIYASCEPCPMCLGAIYWARIPVVYYSGDRHDAAKAGFDDSHIYSQVALTPGKRDLQMTRLKPELAAKVFQKWADQPGKKEY